MKSHARHHRHHHGRSRGPFDEAERSRGRRHGGRGRGRAPRGDVRTAVLLLLEDEPMHGYQLMQSIAERTGGAWAPSPGAIYPTINQLEDEGLVAVRADAGRKLVTLTDAGRAQLAEQRDAWGDPFAGYDAAAPGNDLRHLSRELYEATRHVGRSGTDAQREAAATILADARRALYRLLADDDSSDDTAADA